MKPMHDRLPDPSPRLSSLDRLDVNGDDVLAFWEPDAKLRNAERLSNC